MRYYVGHFVDAAGVDGFLQGALEGLLVSRGLSLTVLRRYSSTRVPSVALDWEWPLPGWDQAGRRLWFFVSNFPDDGSQPSEEVLREIAQQLRAQAASFLASPRSEPDAEGFDNQRLTDLLGQAIQKTVNSYGASTVAAAMDHDYSWSGWYHREDLYLPSPVDRSWCEEIAGKACEQFCALLSSTISAKKWAEQIPLSARVRAEVDAEVKHRLNDGLALPADEEAAAWIPVWVETASRRLFLRAAQAWGEMIAQHPTLAKLTEAYQAVRRIPRKFLTADSSLEPAINPFCQHLQKEALAILSNPYLRPQVRISEQTDLYSENLGP